MEYSGMLFASGSRTQRLGSPRRTGERTAHGACFGTADACLKWYFLPCQPDLWFVPRVRTKPSLCSNQSGGTRSRTCLKLDGQLVASTLQQSESPVSRLPCGFREQRTPHLFLRMPIRLIPN